MTGPHIAICVGHSRSNDNGAVSSGGESEWAYNSRLASSIAGWLGDCGCTTVIIDAYEGGTYVDAIDWLVDELEAQGVDAAIELHFNSYSNAAARGHEWLYWHESEGGLAMAQALDRSFRSSVSEIPARGVKGLSSGNGSYFLGSAHCPSVIGEPFFGSSPDDWEIATNVERIAQAYAVGIREWATSSFTPRPTPRPRPRPPGLMPLPI